MVSATKLAPTLGMAEKNIKFEPATLTKAAIT